jgi:hypothetical protein
MIDASDGGRWATETASVVGKHAGTGIVAAMEYHRRNAVFD